MPGVSVLAPPAESLCLYNFSFRLQGLAGLVLRSTQENGGQLAGMMQCLNCSMRLYRSNELNKANSPPCAPSVPSVVVSLRVCLVFTQNNTFANDPP